MFGFPTETLEEAKETVHFLKDNMSILSHSTGAKFVLLEGAPILNDLKKYRITRADKIRAGFSFAYKYDCSEGMTKEQMDELDRYKMDAWEYKNFRFADSSFREKVFLYVCRYGLKRLSKMKEDGIWM